MQNIDLRKIGVGMVFVAVLLLTGCQAPTPVNTLNDSSVPAVPKIHGPDAAPAVKGPTALR